MIHRRSVLALLAAASGALLPRRTQAAAPAEHRPFIDAAFRMRDDAVKAGDQSYGAVVVKDARIIGFGPSRVILKNDTSAHAEREAMREAQARLGSGDLSGCVLYSSARPCAACEAYAKDAKIARMYFGADALDAGAPR